jgi:hypothetical protein
MVRAVAIATVLVKLHIIQCSLIVPAYRYTQYVHIAGKYYMIFIFHCMEQINCLYRACLPPDSLQY